jgi:hypothetical protein
MKIRIYRDESYHFHLADSSDQYADYEIELPQEDVEFIKRATVDYYRAIDLMQKAKEKQKPKKLA